MAVFDMGKNIFNIVNRHSKESGIMDMIKRWDNADKHLAILEQLEGLLTPPVHDDEIKEAIVLLERTALELRDSLSEERLAEMRSHHRNTPVGAPCRRDRNW